MFYRDDRAALLAAALMLLVVLLMLLRSSDAAFAATSATWPDGFTGGRVALADDDATAMFAVANMKRGDASVTCIPVTYGGPSEPVVELYGPAPAGDGLDHHLDMTVRRGIGGELGSCAGFTPRDGVAASTLGEFAATHSAFATGIGAWARAGAVGETTTYRFEVALLDNDVVQALTTTAVFTWEARKR